MLSKRNQAMVEAYRRGYRVAEDGTVLSPTGEVRKVKTDYAGYKEFSVAFQGRGHPIRVHRLLAYQRFGEAMFAEGVQIRHLDGTKENFPDNLALGSASQNAMDRTPEARADVAKAGARAVRKLSYAEAEQIRAANAAGKSYRELVKEWGVSKATISYIVTKKTYMVGE